MPYERTSDWLRKAYRILYPGHDPSEMSYDQLGVRVVAALNVYQERAFTELLAHVDQRLDHVSYTGDHDGFGVDPTTSPEYRAARQLFDSYNIMIKDVVEGVVQTQLASIRRLEREQAVGNE